MPPSPIPDYTPPCAHFGACGGCSLQHIAPDAYAAAKQEKLASWLQHLGQPAEVLQPLWITPPHSRRRATLALRSKRGVVQVGFQAARSHETIDTPHCTVLHPDLLAVADAIRALLPMLKKPGTLQSLQLTVVANGVDAALGALSAPPAADIAALQAWATDVGLVRLMLQITGAPPKRLHQSAPPLVKLGNAQAELPVGGFLQATQDAETVMVRTVLAGLEGCRKVADLYCGMGTFTLPLLATGAQLWAWEGSEEAIHALHNAARQSGHDPMLVAEMRDLVRQPVPARTLAHCDGAVINPPRNGAGPQCAQLAASGIPRIVMVSCNPATAGRDARALLAAGYRITHLQGIDQFLWSNHLELVAQFVRL